MLKESYQSEGRKYPEDGDLRIPNEVSHGIIL